jgi:predicted secreted protein
MPEFRGTALVIQVLPTSGGTLTLHDQYRTLRLRSETAVIEVTAGTTSWRDYIAGLSAWRVRYDGLNNGPASPLGTADIATLRGAGGTIRISPHGTAAGNIRYQGAVQNTRLDLDYPFDDLASVTIEWHGSGALTESVW